MLSIPVLLHACSEDWTCNLQMIVYVEAITVTLCVVLDISAKRCGNNNKDEDNSPKTLNDKNQQVSSQKFRQLLLVCFILENNISRCKAVTQRLNNIKQNLLLLTNIIFIILFGNIINDFFLYYVFKSSFGIFWSDVLVMPCWAAWWRLEADGSSRALWRAATTNVSACPVRFQTGRFGFESYYR